MRYCCERMGQSRLGSPHDCFHPSGSPVVTPRGHSLETLQLPFSLLIAASHMMWKRRFPERILRVCAPPAPSQQLLLTPHLFSWAAFWCPGLCVGQPGTRPLCPLALPGQVWEADATWGSGLEVEGASEVLGMVINSACCTGAAILEEVVWGGPESGYRTSP